MDFKTYLQKHARKLDLYLYQYLFEGGNSASVLTELASFQNADGGFGNALEPDLRLPGSSVLATTVAFQYLSQLDVDGSSTLMKDAIRYLTESYDATTNGWLNLPPAADNYPRAPWWEYKNARASTEWGNPTAEVLGYLLKYALDSNAELLDKLSEQSLNRLGKTAQPEPHEVKCFIRLYENVDEELRQSLYKPLAKHIKQVTETNPKGWGGYVPTPLTFITSPDSPFADLFDQALLLENAKFLQKQAIDNNHWEPTWEWGQFEKDWAKAKLEWSGKITVENLKTLKAFGII